MKKLFLTTAFLLSFIPFLTPAISYPLPAFAAHPGGTVYADVNGLVCDFCARALEKIFGKQDAVESIDVDLDTKVITIFFNEGQSLDDKTITELITDSGYNVREIRHEQ